MTNGEFSGCLSFFNEGFPTGRTSDLDFALATGNTYFGFTGGAFKIAKIFSAFDSGEKLKKFLVFRIPSGSIPGKNTPDGQYQRNICQKGQKDKTSKTANEIEDNASNTPEPGERIDSVSACHETANRIAYSLEHKITSRIIIVIIFQQGKSCNGEKEMFINFLRFQQFNQCNFRPVKQSHSLSA